jgi:hypothetical protein
MESQTLAQELCERMKEVVPPGIKISVKGDMLVFRSDFGTGSSGSYACQWLHQGTGHISDRLRDACWHAFSDLQDFVNEETAEPWPGLRTPPVAHARIENNSAIVWFGASHTPDLEIRSVPLDDY